MKLTPLELDTLKEALHFLHMSELKESSLQLGLLPKGKKLELIERIVIFLREGKILSTAPIPAISRAKKGQNYPLARETLILKGAYKNDLKTRNFFKSLIGDHFHFTARGIDWISERWLAGDPPTYGEFASEWTQQNEAPKPEPKPEWAYLTFIQKFLEDHPQASREEITAAWEKKRLEKLLVARKLIDKASD